MKRLLWLVLILVVAHDAFAYPSYVRLGYVSCTACHFLSTGGGLLTPYGRTVQDGESLFSKELEPPEKRFSQGVQARLIETNNNRQANPFLMQADYLASVFVSKQVRIDGDFGGALQRGPHGTWVDAPGGWDAVLIRRFLVTGVVNDASLIQMGRDFYPMGLNIDDHTSFLKSRNKRNITDYPTQLRYIHQSETVQLMPYLYGPSYEESSDNQESGGGMRTEFALNSTNSVGALAQIGNTPVLSRTVADGFVRLSVSNWNGLLSEYVFEHRKIHSVTDTVDQWTWYTEPFVAIPEWIETGFVYEYLHASEPNQEVSFQYGPRINIRIVDWISLLGDARNISVNGLSSWNYYGQAFLHLQI